MESEKSRELSTKKKGKLSEKKSMFWPRKTFVFWGEFRGKNVQLKKSLDNKSFGFLFFTQKMNGLKTSFA